MIPLSQRITFALDLARQPEGYLSPWNDIAFDLEALGLVTVRKLGDGFVILHAVKDAPPTHRVHANGRRYRLGNGHGSRRCGGGKRSDGTIPGYGARPS